MSRFSIEIPVSNENNSEKFLSVAKEWLQGSKWVVFNDSDYPDFSKLDGQWDVAKNGELLSLIKFVDEDKELCSFRHRKNDEYDIEWITTLNFYKNIKKDEAWISMHTACQSPHISKTLPAVKKPVYVRVFLAKMDLRKDDFFDISDRAIYLNSSDMDLAKTIVNNGFGGRLPVVYISAKFRGGYSVNVDGFAKKMSGLAHVVVEPDRAFSNRLKDEVDEVNVYGGAIGVYWAGSSARRSLYAPQNFSNIEELEAKLYDDIAKALSNRRPLENVTWSYIQDVVSKSKINRLIEEKSTDIDSYIKTFDNDLKEKSEEIVSLQIELDKLTAELAKVSLSNKSSGGVEKIAERDFYLGEIDGLIYETISDAVERARPQTRKQDILQKIKDKYSPSTEGAEIKEKIKRMFKGYRSMSGKMKNDLESYGFHISQEGEHYKMNIKGNPKYTVIISKTASDNRAGDNIFTDINHTFF